MGANFPTDSSLYLFQTCRWQQPNTFDTQKHKLRTFLANKHIFFEFAVLDRWYRECLSKLALPWITVTFKLLPVSSSHFGNLVTYDQLTLIRWITQCLKPQTLRKYCLGKRVKILYLASLALVFYGLLRVGDGSLHVVHRVLDIVLNSVNHLSLKHTRQTLTSDWSGLNRAPGPPEVTWPTWLSTSMAMSTNMSWSSRMLFSSLMISVCRVSISFRACLVIWESILICRTSLEKNTNNFYLNET